MNKQKPQAGFTLLEIMIALAILATVSASVVQIISRGVDTTLLLENESYAYVLAESKMDELLLLKDVRDGEGGGVFAGDDGFRYQVAVTEQPYDGSPRVFELLHIDVTVLWGGDEDPYDITLEALKTQLKSR